jgi:hypothetical protein
VELENLVRLLKREKELTAVGISLHKPNKSRCCIPHSSSLPLHHLSISLISIPAINYYGFTIHILLLVHIDYMLVIPMLQEWWGAVGASFKVHIMYLMELHLGELIHSWFTAKIFQLVKFSLFFHCASN